MKTLSIGLLAIICGIAVLFLLVYLLNYIYVFVSNIFNDEKIGYHSDVYHHGFLGAMILFAILFALLASFYIGTLIIGY